MGPPGLAPFGVGFDTVYSQEWKDYFPWLNQSAVADEELPWRVWDNQARKP